MCELPSREIIRPVSSVRAAAVCNVERYGRSKRRAAPPGSLPHQQAKGPRLHRSSWGADTRSAWCFERSSPRAREASSSNPARAAGVVGQTLTTSNPAILSHLVRGSRATGKNPAQRPTASGRVTRSGCESRRGGPDHSRLGRQIGCESRQRSVQPCRRGEFPAGDSRDRAVNRPGDLRKVRGPRTAQP